MCGGVISEASTYSVEDEFIEPQTLEPSEEEEDLLNSEE